MRTAIISDTHLGSGSGSDLLGREQFVETLLAALEGTDRLVLLGDTIELRDRPVGEALDASRLFFEGIGRALGTGEVVLVPGNHDHRLLGHWLERVRDRTTTVELDEVVEAPHPIIGRLDSWLGEATLTLRYPGVWVREDIFATHGHYLDSHITLPTVERLSIATVDRMGGRPTGRRSAPQDYEKVHAPVYDLLFDLAQGARNPQAQKNDGAPSMRIWEMIGGASGRARSWRGRALRSAVIPGTLRGLERAGLGSFGRDFSAAEIGRAGVEAMHEVVDRLAVDAEHVIFGHIHRRGALAGEDGRAATDPVWERRGTTLHNTGCWLYTPAMLGRSSVRSPFWPGRMIFVNDEGPPEAVELLADARPDELELPGSV
jgi:metallophosphoesterase superfamily enzyme